MLIILGVIGLSYSSSVRTQYQITQKTRSRREAYWAARAGIEKAMAMLSTTDLKNLTDTSPIFDDGDSFDNQHVGQGTFSLIVPPVAADDPTRHGVLDENSRIDVNSASESQLMLLPGMTIDMAESLMDWRDSDRFPRAFGAEDDYYESLDNPYAVKNSALGSIRELVRVRDWEPVFHAAFPDPYEKYLPEEKKPEAADRDTSVQLLGMLTAWSSSDDNAPDGQKKLNLNQATDGQMKRRIPRMNDAEATAIVTYRKTKQFQSATDLLDVPGDPKSAAANKTPTPTPVPSSSNSSSGSNAKTPTPTPNSKSSSQGSSSSRTSSSFGSKGLFTPDRVAEIIDYFTAETSNSNSSSNAAKTGLININTASHDVLMTIPSMSEDIANNILQRRASGGAFQGPGSTATVLGVTDSAFRKIYPKVTTSSMRFRATSVGHSGEGVAGSDATVTVEAVIALQDGSASIVYWREY